ncbi:30S ribosomal protein S1 [Roseimaritima multifibrata]|uniref:Small ribosomal subunit protein bS1 n=1 Tax=Roseimaritima multifibrata TaxID=1930274 RepID=A0A517ME94_9BACT|nr:30S ribosomal protein S1 [Roseimaritima multifibrata]QDS93210.1 30S ribosomal protein S1 [Roseimaritima multifibrata]
MVNRNLIRALEDDDLAEELALLAPAEDTEDELFKALEQEQQDYIQGKIVDGRIVELNDEWALVDVGFKSEGTIGLDEWGPEEAQPKVGDTVKVLIEEMEDELGAADDPYGMISLSKRKAEKIIQWEEMMESVAEGQVVTGTVIRKIKGGLLVDIGVNVFLPGSQVDIRRPGDIGDFIGRVIQAEVLKIDDTRRNIVISRRSLIENQREEDRAYLMKELENGQIRKGIVKNIADFGAFVDLGGIDGLLHITDMAWERIGHPSEMVAIDQEIEVKVLNIDREKQKIALGLKQKDRNPWENIETKYPVDTTHPGEVVNVMSYGAFVKLEPGIEGLVHISEMSWTKRVNHPSELVNIGDSIEVKILGVDPEGQQLSLGMKQTQKNPWDEVLDRYPEGTDVSGHVRNLTNYGAFIELEEGIDGLLHVSDMSWTRKISHPSELLEKGQEVHCRVLSVDQDRRRIALGLKQLDSDPWTTDIPEKYQPGQLVNGNVTKITNFGVFVGLEDGLEGLLHISELADHKVDDPEEVVKVGDPIEVKILRVDTDERKIGLSRKRVDWAEEQEEAAAEEERQRTAGSDELKGGLGGSDGLLIPTSSPKGEATEVAAAEEVAAEEAPADEAAAEEAPAEASSEESDEEPKS